MKARVKQVVASAVMVIVTAGAAVSTVWAEQWTAAVGAENADLGSQALAFLPNQLWIHAGDSILWTSLTHEKHTVTFLKPAQPGPPPQPAQTRPPGFGPVFGVLVGCPGTTASGSSFDGTSCVTSDVLQLSTPTTTYKVNFPSPGNFKLVCLLHADMTGVVHVLTASATLPYDQDFYDRQAHSERARLLANASSLQGRGDAGDSEDDADQSAEVAAGIGEIVTLTGVGSQTASLMRFERGTIVVRVGDTVEWANQDPSINHTVTFGSEPTDPRPLSANVTTTADGARQAVVSSPSDSVTSGFLTPTPQDRANLAQGAPGVTRFRVTFTAPGTFKYICAIHDELGMTGTVIVHP
jgi:plastocyanin